MGTRAREKQIEREGVQAGWWWRTVYSGWLGCWVEGRSSGPGTEVRAFIKYCLAFASDLLFQGNERPENFPSLVFYVNLKSHT
jgi:hypothetical protein